MCDFKPDAVEGVVAGLKDSDGRVFLSCLSSFLSFVICVTSYRISFRRVSITRLRVPHWDGGARLTGTCLEWSGEGRGARGEVPFGDPARAAILARMRRLAIEGMGASRVCQACRSRYGMGRGGMGLNGMIEWGRVSGEGSVASDGIRLAVRRSAVRRN